MPTARDDDALRHAQMKQAQGRGLKNSELALLRHAEKVQVFASKPRAPIARISEGDTRTSLQAGRDSLASAKATGTDAALTARVAALESSVAALVTSNAALVALVTGLTRQTVTYCSGGSSTSKTMLMS